MPSKKQHDLLSKSDIAKALGMTSQTFSNRQSRDPKFPEPTYSNRSGSVALYAPEDAKKVYEYCTRAERERLQKAEQMFASLTGSGEPAAFEDVKLPIEEEKPAEAPKAEAPKAEAPKVEAPKAEEKPAAAPAKTEAKPAVTAAEKAAKDQAIADKIKDADAKIEAKKAAATTQAPKGAPAQPAKAPVAAKAPAGKATGTFFSKA